MNKLALRADPRYFILLFLICFTVAGQMFLGFFQRWDALFASITAAVAAEFVLTGIVFKQWKFPLSALISGIGIGLLLSSHLLWPFAVTALLAIVSKYLIRIGGRHVFNPNNIAIVSMLFFLPQYAVSTPKQWTNGFDVMLLIMVLGLIAAYVAKRLDTVLAFFAGYVLFAGIRHILFGEPLLYSFGPMLGASFQLFVFFMITDPKTTPPTRLARIVVAISIALADAILRTQEVTNSLFYAAFLVTLLGGIPYRWILSKRRKSEGA